MSVRTLFFVAFLGNVRGVSAFVVNQPCPNGWIREDDSCYFFEIQPKSWHNAVIYCKSLRSHLVAIETSSEYNFLVDQLKKMHIGTYQEYWTSGNDIEVEGNWVWNPTRDRVTLSKWGPGEPNTYHGHQEDCMTLRNNGGIFLFNDEGCDYTRGFICEM